MQHEKHWTLYRKGAHRHAMMQKTTRTAATT